MKRSIRGDMLRRAVADEAARLMIEHGLDDFGTAKRKAAERFGVTVQRISLYFRPAGPVIDRAKLNNR